MLIRDWLIDFALASARKKAMDRHRRINEQERTAVVIAPAAAGSMGDAAMLNVVRDQLRQRGFSSVSVLSPEGWSPIDGFDNYFDFDPWFFGGRRSYLVEAIKLLSGYSHSFLIGADCIDGTYNPQSIIRRMTLIDEHARMGGNARIMGASFSEFPKSEAVERIRSLDQNVLICSRDPVSRERLQAATSRKVRQTADLAFLTAREPIRSEAVTAREFIKQQSSMGRPTIGLNINWHIERKSPGYASAHGQCVRMALEQGYSLILAPHDTRGSPSDWDLLKRAVTGLEDQFGDRMFFLAEMDPPSNIAVFEKLHFLITGRMHAAILAMTGGTPALCFTYQGKFEGLYKLLKLDDLSLLHDPNELANDPNVWRKIFETLDAHAIVAPRVEDSYEIARAAALRNFE